jgi:hypothetical protein
MATALDKNFPGQVVAGVNGDFFDMGVGVPATFNFLILLEGQRTECKICFSAQKSLYFFLI